MVSQPHEEGQGNQAACLNLLTNAVIVWNTVLCRPHWIPYDMRDIRSLRNSEQLCR